MAHAPLVLRSGAVLAVLTLFVAGCTPASVFEPAGLDGHSGGHAPGHLVAPAELLGPDAASKAVTPAALAATPLPRSGWTATASDEEPTSGSGEASNVLDGDVSTYWHSQSSGPPTPLPQWITLDMKTARTVAGLRYLPASGRTAGGRIGRFEIRVSADGTTWSAPVATGTWADTADEKTAEFHPVSARFVRLSGLTEAGDRGPWLTAAELNLFDQSAAPTAAALPAAVRAAVTASTVPAATVPTATVPTTSLGSWGPTIGFPLVPAAAALLPGNKLLTWSAYSTTNYGGSNGRTQTAILDLASGVVSRTEVSNTKHDMFCPGTAMLRDGRLLVSGGSNSGATSIYNPSTKTWTAGAPMKVPRGYHSNVTLSTGEVFALGGSWSGGVGGKHGEVWSASAGWRRVPGASVTPMLTADPAGGFRSDNHAWLFAISGGKVFHAGPSKRMNTYSTTGTGGVKSAGTRADSPDAMNGNAVMYGIRKMLTIGGAPAYSGSDATARAYTIDIDLQGGVRTTRVGDMAYRRAFASAVVLPDGKVLVTGGQSRAQPFSDANAAMRPEIWNPSTGEFTTLAAMAVPRTYHSFALLLPDARVFVGGGGLCGTCSTNHPNGQIFTPPYLLNGDGTAKPRPSISKAPASARNGESIQVTTSAPIKRFSLVRFGSVTHTVNTDQRRIPLTAVSTSGNTATLKLPSSTGALVPGRYLLFALDAAGVPSVAKTIRIG